MSSHREDALLLGLAGVAEAVAHSLQAFYYDWCGTIWLLVAVALLLGLSLVARQTGKEGAPPARPWCGEPLAWADRSTLAAAGSDHLKAEQCADFRYGRYVMNRPWKEPDPALSWSVSEAGLTNLEWMGGRPFPGGQLKRDGTVDLTVRFWKFVLKRYKADSRWCLFLSVLIGFVEAVKVTLAAMIISVVKAKDEEPDASRSETRNKLVRVVIFTLVLHALTGAMDWSFHLEVPDGGVVRDLTFRLQSKFLALSTDPDSAAAWPPNRCEALLAYSVFKAVEVWISLFSLARALATIGSTVAVTIYLNPHYLAVFTAGSRTNFVPFFFIVVCTDVVEFMHRREHLRDLSRREHDARLGSLAVLSKQVEWSRSAAALGSKVDAVEAADLEASKVAVVVLWRRCFHAFMHRVASAKAFSGVMKVATAILTYRAGMMVVEGQIDISQFVALILSLGVLAQARDALRQTMVTCYYNEPSLRAISDVLNMGEDFSDEASSGEDDDESATLV